MLSIPETRNRRRFERRELRSSQYIFFLCEHFNSLRIYYLLSRLIANEKLEKNR